MTYYPCITEHPYANLTAAQRKAIEAIRQLPGFLRFIGCDSDNTQRNRGPVCVPFLTEGGVGIRRVLQSGKYRDVYSS